jgi:vitamin B12 transporter
MSKNIFKNLLWLSLFSFIFSQEIAKLKTITVDVKANGANGYYDKHNNFSYIDSEMLDAWVERDSIGVLKRVAGINAINSGGTKTLLLNGFASNQSKILYHGVDMFDSSAPQGTPYIDAISLVNIDSVEVIRGAASSYYGNSAVAGVINIVPSVKTDTSYFVLFGERYFAHNFRTGLQGNWYKLSVSYNDSNQNQLSWTNDPVSNNLEKKQNFELDAELQVDDKTKAGLFYSDNKVDNEIDVASWDATTYLAKDGFGVTGKMVANHIIYGLSIFRDFEDLGNLDLKYSVADIKRENSDEYFGQSLFSAMLTEMDLKFSEKFSNKDLVWGISRRVEKAKIQSFGEKEQDDLSLYNILSVESLINFSLGSRVTSYTKDKAVFTYNISLWKKIADYEFKLNHATGYRQPTLFEKYGKMDFGWGPFDVGNPNLIPETSRLFDFGLVYNGIYNAILRTNIFSSVINSKIDWVGASYMNVSSDTLIDGYSFGIELLAIPFTKKATTEYVYTNSRNDSGQSLRVPKQKANLDLLFDIFGCDLSVFYSKVASRKDSGAVILPFYQTVDLALSKKFDSSEIFIKGVNIFGENYQEVNGYNTLKSAWYVGYKTSI